MKADSVAGFVAAALFHALLLFGFRLQSPARPLALSDDPPPVDVSIVDSAPAPPGPVAAAPSRPPEPAPTPVPTPASEPQPTPEPTEQQPMPETETPSPPPAPTTNKAIAEVTPVLEHPKPMPRSAARKHSFPHSASGSAAELSGITAGHGLLAHGVSGGENSTRARYLSNPDPDYPAQERQAHHEGLVHLSVEVGPDGRASDVSVTRSSGFPQLDAAAVRAVRRWTFEPARTAGLPISSRVEVPVRFSLAN